MDTQGSGIWSGGGSVGEILSLGTCQYAASWIDRVL